MRRSGHSGLRVWRLTRAGNISVNGTTVTQRSATFASSAPDGSVLLTRRGGGGLEHFLIAPTSSSRVDQAAIQLAQTVAARADEVDDPEQLMCTKHVARLEFEHGAAVRRDTQSGADISQVSVMLATAVREGEWVAAVLRRPKKREYARHQRWLKHQLDGVRTHHSVQTGSVVMSLFAGSDSGGREAETLVAQAAATLQGFDTPVRGELVSVWDSARYSLGAAALFGLAAAGVWVAGGDWSGLWWLPAAVGGACAGLTGLIVKGVVPTRAGNLRRLLSQNRLPVPRLRLKPPRKPVSDRQGPEGLIEGRDGDYPLTDTSFLVGAQLPVSMVAPHAGAASGQSSTQSRSAPSVMESRIGPFLGYNNDQPVHLSADDAYQGTALFGMPGSGKSRVVQALFGWSCLDRSVPAGLAGFPGSRHTLVAIESKGEGADAYEEYARLAGDEALRIDFATGSFGLNILAVPGNAERRARFVVNALKYAFSDGSIQDRSFDTLIQVFTAAFATTRELAASVPGVNPDASVFHFASVLLGDLGDSLGVALAGAIRSETARLGDAAGEDLVTASQKLSNLYEGRSATARANLTEAPRNKVSALLAAEQWWSRPYQITWDELLNSHRAVVINTGITTGGAMEDDQLVSQFSSMLMFSLYEAIQRNCSGWFEQGRAVSVFTDELTRLAGSSSTVITWFREQGRSYGVRPVFATQYPEQLSTEVRNSVLGFGTVLAFAQNNPQVVANLVADLTMTGEEWTGADVANLPRFEAIVRASANGHRQPPFTVSLYDFWGDREGFAAVQGYDGVGS